MGSYNVIKNNTLIIDPITDYEDNGWTVSQNIAKHSGCNSGLIGRRLNLSTSTNWTIKFEIQDLTSGVIQLLIEGVQPQEYSEKGIYTFDFYSSNPNSLVQFFSDGIAAIKYLQAYPTSSDANGTTIIFNEDVNSWGGEHSYRPEFYHKFLNNVFSFLNGTLWVHDENPIKNNFYGVQYTSKIRFVANDNASNQKRYIMMKIDSNKRWGAREISILPNETYPNGMSSILHENNFTLDKGEYWASFLRDMKDPQYTVPAQALFEGRELEGKLMIMELECIETTDTQLNSVYIYSTEKFRDF